MAPAFRFLADIPRELRDQIYSYVLTPISGPAAAQTSPWIVELTQFKYIPPGPYHPARLGEIGESRIDFSLLRTCKQIHRECKDIIWRRNGLYLRATPEFYLKFHNVVSWFTPRIRELNIQLELLDRDELDWVSRSISIFASEKSRHACPERIRLIAVADRPSTLQEFKDFMTLTKCGESLDGRLCRELIQRIDGYKGWIWSFNTGWPRFSSWGKQRWLRQMLLDSTNCETLVKELHDSFGGELYIDKVLCYKDHVQVADTLALDAREGEILICPRMSPSLPLANTAFL
ncbi:hypothetical protein F5884DRAFT_765385 [Xylogone sp. PMI_703]|nr:hypothetical protein F5884DRAFT_765385 [Xylogone sp. PMI_703]